MQNIAAVEKGLAGGVRRTARSPLCWLALASLALVACDATPPAPVTLRIAIFETQDFLPYYVIRERGLDKKHGLHFEEQALSGGAAAIDAMAAGKVDLCPGVATVPLIRAAESGIVPQAVVAVAANNFADAEHPAIGVVASGGVSDWGDLRGAKIGTSVRNSIVSAAVEARLQQAGVREYSLVEIPFSNLGLAVAGGNVAAAGMNEPYLTQSLLRKDGSLLGWVVGGPPLDKTQFTSIAFSANFVRHNRRGVKAYLRAHLEAVRWINEHPAEARALLVTRLQLTKEVGSRIRLLYWPAQARSDIGLLEGMQRVLLQYGLLERPVDLRQLHDEALLRDVLEEKR